MLGKMIDNGFTSKAVVQYTGNLNDENVKRFVKLLTDYAEEKHQYEGAKYFIPAPLGATITPLNVKLADNEYAELTKYSALQIAAAFGIKPTQINDYTKSSYSSEEAQQLNFYKETLLFPLEQYEQELDYKMLTDKERRDGEMMKFETDVILRVTQEQQMTILRSGIANFIYTPNEAREKLDLPPVEGGDKLIGNGTNIPIDMVGQQYSKAQQAEGGEDDG
jgi:HK97 family phage portal protein